MYYHIIIETDEKKGDSFETMYKYDIEDLEKIKKDYIIPYLQEESIRFNGYSLLYNKIRKVAVKSSSKPIDTIVETHQDRTCFMVLFSRENVVKSSDLLEDITDEIFNVIAKKTTPKISSNEIDKKKVFIVHGHDELMKTTVARFIEKFGIKAIILHEQANAGLTIIEKIEKYSDVGFGVILYSPCDKGAANKKNETLHLQFRARQNVVFEHGYLTAKLGRSNVAVLLKDNVEKPGDSDGIVYIPYDNANWQNSLAKELLNAGYDIDLNSILY